MVIQALPSPTYPRRYCTVKIDPSSGGVFLYNPVFLNAIPDYDTSHSGTAERYDPASGTWTTLAESSERVQIHYGDWIDSTGKWSRVGGQALGPPDSFVTTMETYNPATDSWSFGPSLPVTKHTNVSWIDSSGVAWTGGGFGGTQRELWKLTGGSWTAMASAPSVFQQVDDFQDSQGRHYFPSDQAGSTRFKRYDPATNVWTPLTNLPVASQRATMSPSHLYLLGSTTFHAYNIAAGTWTTLAAKPPPVGTIVYHPPTHAVYLLGGISGSPIVASSTIYKYDIATNVWSTTTDSLTTFRVFTRSLGSIAFDGTGYYIGQGSTTNNRAVNVVDYWIPDPVRSPRGAFGVGMSMPTVSATLRAGRAYAQIIGGCL